MKYFFGFLVAVALVILVFILILRGFSSPKQPIAQTNLTDYSATDTTMRLEIEGPVNLDQDHRIVIITVGRNQTEFQLFQGYQRTQLNSQTYTNNEAGYSDFLRALQLQGYTHGNADPKKADDRGVCPTGKRFRYEIITGNDTVQNFYSSTCGGGTFKGNGQIIRRLFRAQIPDYADLTKGLGFTQ